MHAVLVLIAFTSDQTEIGTLYELDLEDEEVREV
jgi:hypothetical protein